MAMVGVVSGSLKRRTHSLSRLAWSWVGGRLAPFYIHQMNRVNSRNSTISIVVLIIIIIRKVIHHTEPNHHMTLGVNVSQFISHVTRE